jgi:hypothetical protein
MLKQRQTKLPCLGGDQRTVKKVTRYQNHIALALTRHAKNSLKQLPLPLPASLGTYLTVRAECAIKMQVCRVKKFHLYFLRNTNSFSHK